MDLRMYLYKAPKGVIDIVKTVPDSLIEIYQQLIRKKYLENLNGISTRLTDNFLEALLSKYPDLEKLNQEEYIITTPLGIESLFERIGYWYNANAIHRWFVENVQNGEDDCDSYKVTREQLEELLYICTMIKENPKLAPELLPTLICSTLDETYFGNTEYGEEYFEHIDKTIKQLEKILRETSFEKYDIVYSSIW